MTSAPTATWQLTGDSVAGRADGVVEYPVDAELILWGPSAPLPLHLNTTAAAVWRDLDDNPTLGEVVRRLAHRYSETPERVEPGVSAAAHALASAGLLLVDERPPETIEPPGSLRPTTVLDPRTTEWLRRRQITQSVVQVGHDLVGVATNSDALREATEQRFGPPADGDVEAAVRYLLLDADDGPGYRYWLLSDSGLPLDRADSVGDLLERLGFHLGEMELLSDPGRGPALRFGLLDATDHCVAVQWDLLAARPMIEARLGDLGYRIRSGQWVVFSPDANVLTAHSFGDLRTERSSMPLRGLVSWFGPGSLDPASSVGEWVWSIAMSGCATRAIAPAERHRFLADVHRLTDDTTCIGLSDPGPTALLTAMADLPRRS